MIFYNEVNLVEIIFLWLYSSFVISFIGINKKVGFGGLFGWCILISPIGGLIIGVTSKEIVFKHKKYLELGQKSEFKGEIEKSISYYMDVLFYLDNDEIFVNNKDNTFYRQKMKNDCLLKIEELKKISIDKI